MCNGTPPLTCLAAVGVAFAHPVGNGPLPPYVSILACGYDYYAYFAHAEALDLTVPLV